MLMEAPTLQAPGKAAASSPKPVVIILTFNSAATVQQVIDSCSTFAARVLVVDSFSSDRTADIARAAGCEVVTHAFENYSKQRNWAQQYAALSAGDWVLHLDSDEVVSKELAASIQRTLAQNPSVDGFLVRRLSYFMGQPIRFGHINPSWHLRLFRASKGMCEERNYDQHFIVPGKTEKLSGLMLDLQLISIESWIASHNRWSTAEAAEVLAAESEAHAAKQNALPATLAGDIRMKKRWMKNRIYYRCPLLLRSMVFFLYSYFLRLGFLDGKAGLIYHVLQAFWFRFVVDAKIIEHKSKR